MSPERTDGQAIAASLFEPRAFGVVFERHFEPILRYLRRRLDAHRRQGAETAGRRGFPTPALQAAIFNALAELTGISVKRDVTDGVGRQGVAIVALVEGGVQWQTIFDPETGELLGSRGILVDPSASRGLAGIPAGTVIDERDFLAVGVVDSTAETPAG